MLRAVQKRFVHKRHARNVLISTITPGLPVTLPGSGVLLDGHHLTHADESVFRTFYAPREAEENDPAWDLRAYKLRSDRVLHYLEGADADERALIHQCYAHSPQEDSYVLRDTHGCCRTSIRG